MSGALVQMGNRLPATDVAAGVAETWFVRRTRSVRVALTVGLLVFLPAALYAAAFALTWRDIGFDLRHAYLPAAHDVLQGLSPYAGAGAQSFVDQTTYVYPPLLAVVVSPLTLLPATAASLLGAVTLLLVVPTTLLLLGVRDWRCYGVVLLWAPVFDAIDNVNVSLLVALGLALAWRYRGRPLLAGVALGVGVALKVFAWPLLLWPVATGRLRAGALSIAVATVAVVVPWAALGFEGLSAYPNLLRRLSEYERDRSYSLHAVLTGVGLPSSVASGAMVAVAAVLLVGVFFLGRRGAELPAFALAIAVALAVSPIVWQHYLVLLLVPLAIARPRLSVSWFLPLVLWASDLRGDNGALWQTVLVPAVAVTLVVVCCRPWDKRERHLSQRRYLGEVA